MWKPYTRGTRHREVRARKKMANNSHPGIQAELGPPDLPLGEESSPAARAHGGAVRVGGKPGHGGAHTSQKAPLLTAAPFPVRIDFPSLGTGGKMSHGK